MDSDPVAAALAELSARNEWRIEQQKLADDTITGFPEGDIRLLLKVAEAALRHHQRVPLYSLASTEEQPGACPHDPDQDHDCHFESNDGEWLCREMPEGFTCSCTESPDGERIPWPCDEVEDILAALNGKAEADG